MGANALASKSRLKARPRLMRNERGAFLNVPYDIKFENLYLAFIAGLCGFGLIPHATLEIAGSERRLDRIVRLIRRCPFSFHDLSRVELDRTFPSTPRFNMPFELGLAMAIAKQRAGKCFVFESRRHRLSKSLSDLDGTDPYIHDGKPEGVLRELGNALYRPKSNPSFEELQAIYKDLKIGASNLKRELSTDSLFAARPFRELVMLAKLAADQRIAVLKR